MKLELKNKRNISIVHNVIYLWGVVESKYGKRFFISALLIILASFAEIINIGAIFPFLAALSSVNEQASYGWLGMITHSFGILSNLDSVMVYAAMFIIAAIFAALIKIALIRTNAKLSFLIAADLSQNIYKRTLYQPYSFHVQRNSSEIINGVIDKTEITMGAVLMLLSLIGSIVMAIAIFIGLMIVDWRATIATFSGLLLVYVFIFSRFRNQLLENGAEISHGSIEVIKVLQEGVGSIRDILIDGSQDEYCEVFKIVDNRLKNARMKNYLISSTPKYFIETIGIILFVALAYFLNSKGSNSSSAIPVLGALALGAQKLLPNLHQVYQAWSNLVASYPSLCETVTLLKLPITESQKSKIGSNYFNENIVFDKVDFFYNNRDLKILENVNLLIKKGARIGVIGESGSGKSTFLDLLMGLLEPSKGEILIDGVALNKKNIHQWQKVISHVPQSIYIKDASIEENIAFGVNVNEINHDKVLKSAKVACIYDDIEKMQLGLKSRTGERGSLLSGGQRQRIGIARAIYKSSKIIILDEATSALDDEIESKVVRNLQMYDPEITIIMVAHRQSSLDGCDLILRVEKGELSVQR